MASPLVERDAELDVLGSALAAANRGCGSVVLVWGEAGIGKTSLINAFAASARRGARLLLAACDDLATQRPIGPLRDATRGVSGPLATALRDEANPDAVFPALLEELQQVRPTVFVVEDTHWAHQDTLDLLLYTARRVADIGVVLVLTYRDTEVSALGRLSRLLGAVADGPVHRMPLAPLSAAAVASLAKGTNHDPAQVYAQTAGNPFLVVQALAAGQHDLPPKAVAAVLARLNRLSPACRDAVQRLCVLPAPVPFDLLDALLGSATDALVEAEIAGFVRVTPDGVAFRHELVRRIIEHDVPRLRRRRLHLAVVAALNSVTDPDWAAVAHHAQQAGDVTNLVKSAPLAARAAAARGARQSALLRYESVLPHLNRLPKSDQAALLDDYGWELHQAHRLPQAVSVATEAARCYESLADPAALGQCLIRLSRHLLLAGAVEQAKHCAKRAITLLGGPGHEAARAHAYLRHGVVCALTGRLADATTLLHRAHELATAAHQPDLAALSLMYLHHARVTSGDLDSLNQLQAALRELVANASPEYAAEGYTTVTDALYWVGRWAELDACVRHGLPLAREHNLRPAAYHLEAHRYLRLLVRGDWHAAEEGLRRLVDEVPEPGVLFAYSEPWLALLRARRGDETAKAALAASWQRAKQQGLLTGIVFAGIALLEWSWIANDVAVAQEVARELLPNLTRPGDARLRAEALCHLARTGVSVAAFPSCPQPYAASLHGDWRAAAQAWQRLGDPYQAALELAASRNTEAMLEAVRIFDELGASAVANQTRRRLRTMGAKVPRGPRAKTKNNPAGLTDRQLAVLRLLRAGLTNAKIAERLVLSVRTVDHHVAAILAKLGVSSRREAIAVATSLGL